MGTVVDDDVPGLDVGVFLSDAFEGAFEQALGHLHDVRLRGAGDRLAAFAAGELEGEPDDRLATLLANPLQALGGTGGLQVFDAGVEVLDVLTDDDEVDAATAVGGRDAGQLADGPDVAVGFE